MQTIQQLVRPNILSARPYSSARDEYQGDAQVYLDANENPFGQYNRYPDPHQITLKSQIAKIKNTPIETIFIGNGSDESIDLLMRVFCTPGSDAIMACTPTYGMYKVSAAIHDIEIVDVPLLPDTFQLDTQQMLNSLQVKNVKLTFICSPNNPTGNLINPQDIEVILQAQQGIVVIDEAYIDFADKPSWINHLATYPNLVIIQTLSKAYGCAALRIGLCVANPYVISLLNKVKPPYNISATNQKLALEILEDKVLRDKHITDILVEKQKMTSSLASIKGVSQIFPSDANFILVQFEQAEALYQYLLEQGIIIRNRTKEVANALRITIGTAVENAQLLNQIQKFYTL